MSRDLASSLFWLAVSIFVVVEGVALKLGTLRQPGPGFFPFWGGVLLGAASLILLFRSFTSRERLELGTPRWPALILVLAVLLGYLLFLETLGFAIVTFVFLVLLFRFGGMGWAGSAAWSLVATSLAYGLFRLWLQVQLPSGLLRL